MPIGIDGAFFKHLHYDNLFILALELLLAGGWLFVFYNVWPHIKDAWINWRQGFFAAENPSVLLEIRLPEKNKRPIEAIEQLFAQIHALRRDQTWWETWWKGQYILKVAFEIVSVEGQIRFFVRPVYKHKHLLEAAIYAQYPDAEIIERKPEEDFIHLFPDKIPDKEFDMLGSEYVLSKPDFYPLKTYKEYQHRFMREIGYFADPLRHLLELMQNLKEGEYLWYQITVVPESDTWNKKQRKHLDRLLGRASIEVESRTIIQMLKEHAFSIFLYILRIPIEFVKEVCRQLFVGTGKIIVSQVKDHTYTEAARQLRGMPHEFWRQVSCLHEAFLGQFRKKGPVSPKKGKGDAGVAVENYMNVELTFPEGKEKRSLTNKEEKVIDAIERKISQQVFKSCVRVLYFAKKPVFAKFRFWAETHGFFRHFNDIDFNVWTRGPYTKTSADYFFAKARKRMRQNAIIFNAKCRDWLAGDRWIYLGTEELATLWHFPSERDLTTNVTVAETPVASPPRGTPMRTREGFSRERLLDVPLGMAPDNLPVPEFEPYNYP